MVRTRRNASVPTGLVIAGAAALGAGLLYLAFGSEAEAFPLTVVPPGKISPEEPAQMPQQTVFEQIAGGNVPAFLRD